MKKAASFTIGADGTQAKGTVYSVVIEAPDNLTEVIGAERASQLLLSFGIAHWVQSKVRAAFKKCNDPGEASPKVIEAAKALMASVQAGEALDFTQFVPAPKGESKEFVAFRDKWNGSTPTKREAYLEFMGLDPSLATESAETVFEAHE